MTPPIAPIPDELPRWIRVLEAATAAHNHADATMALDQIRALNTARAAQDVRDAQPSALVAAGMGASQGATFGFGDELAGLTGAAAAGLQGAPAAAPAAYTTLRDAAREEQNASRAAHPIANVAGDVVASLAVPIPALRTGQALQPAARLATRFAEGAILGGATAAAQAAGRTEGGLPERAQAALAAAPLGAATGAVLTGILGRRIDKYETERLRILKDAAQRDFYATRTAESLARQAKGTAAPSSWEQSLRTQLEKLGVPPEKIDETVLAEATRRGAAVPAPAATGMPSAAIPPEAPAVTASAGRLLSPSEVRAARTPTGLDVPTYFRRQGGTSLAPAAPSQVVTGAQGEQVVPVAQQVGQRMLQAETPAAKRATQIVAQQTAEGYRGPRGGMRVSKNPPVRPADLGDLSQFSTEDLNAMLLGPRSIKSGEVPPGTNLNAIRGAIKEEIIKRTVGTGATAGTESATPTVAQGVGQRLGYQTATGQFGPSIRMIEALKQPASPALTKGVLSDWRRAAPSTRGKLITWLSTHTPDPSWQDVVATMTKGTTP